MKLWKLLHLAAIAAFAGGLLALLVMPGANPHANSDALGALWQALAQLLGMVAVPALLLVFVSGGLLLVVRPAHLGARWVWAKVALSVLLAAAALAVLKPAVDRAAAVARYGAQGTPAMHPLDDLLATAHWAALGCLLLAALIAAIALWRPRLGQRE